MDKIFSIQVLTLDKNILKYKVYAYSINEGMVSFTDPKTGMIKIFPVDRTTIDQVKE